MSYKIKTLIIFDANSLRKINRDSNDKDVIEYHIFDLGSPFKKIQKFIKENSLEKEVKLSIPRFVLDELNIQKSKQYKKDSDLLKILVGRIQQISTKRDSYYFDSHSSFDHSAFIRNNLEEFISDNNISIIPFKDEHSNEIFNSMVDKVIDVENVKSPFRPKDAGFKDNIIWECILRYEEISNFNTIFFLSKDGDFKENCFKEFKDRWPNQYFDIRKDENNIIVELEKLYSVLLTEREIYNFTDTYYFSDYLFKELKSKSVLTFEGRQLVIENFKVSDFCLRVDRSKDESGGFNRVSIVSKIALNVNDEGIKKEIEIEAITEIEEDPMGVIETSFNYELN